MIQTTSRCNGSCSFCPYPDISSSIKHGVMSKDLFIKIIEECKENYEKIDTIMPYLMNDPLLDLQLTEKIFYIKNNVPYTGVHFLTNGLLLNRQTGDKIIDSPLDWIGISFFGTKKSVYESAMNLPYEKVKKRVNEFILKALDKRGEEFIMMTFFKWHDMTQQDIDDTLTYWKNLGIKRISFYEGGISRAGNVKSIPCPNNEKMNFCDSIWTQETVHILYNGDVILCCMDWRKRHILGNVKNQSIHEIWNSQNYNDIRNVINGNSRLTSETLCYFCEMAKYSVTEEKTF